MSMLFSLSLAILAAYFLLKPHLGLAIEEMAPAVRPEQTALGDQKQRCLQVLKDLELDYSTGKIPQGDYEETKKSISSELAAILGKIDELGSRS